MECLAVLLSFISSVLIKQSRPNNGLWNRHVYCYKQKQISLAECRFKLFELCASSNIAQNKNKP